MFLFAGNLQAQTSVTTSTKSMVTSKMFLLNTPDRKVSVELTLSRDTSLSKQWKPQLNIYSYGKSLQYLTARNAAPGVENGQVRFFIDGGRELNIESRYYFYLRENVRNGASISFRSFNPQISGLKVLDEGGKEVGGFLGEVINNDLGFDVVPALNEARMLEIRIGAEKFTLDRDQLLQFKEAIKDAK